MPKKKTRLRHGFPSQDTAQDAAEAHFDALTGLLESGEYSDLRIASSREEYKVHRAIVCSQSAVFKAMLQSGFKEANSSIISLPEDDPDAVKSMIAYLYTLDYSYNDAAPDAYLSHARMYTIADRYQIAGLKTLALDHFRNIHQVWNNEIMQAVAREAYEGTPASDPELRRAVTELFRRNKSALSDPLWKSSAHDMGELMYDVLMSNGVEYDSG